MNATLWQTYYTVEDDGKGGSTTVETREPEKTELVFNGPAEFEQFCEENDLTEDNGHWFSDPDISHTVDYRTGEQVETIIALDQS